MNTSLVTVFLNGIGLLLGAILMNVLAKSFELKSWYDYILSLQKLGVAEATKALGIPSIIFLFVVYPLVLGLIIELLVSKR